MARRRSPSGRARPKTLENQLYITASKVNKRLNRLDKGNVYGRYSSRKLLQFVNAEKNILYSRKGKNKIKIRNMGKLTDSEKRLYQKQMERFLKSPTSSVQGVQKVKEDAMRKVKSTLSAETGVKLTDDDIEDFYNLINNNDDYKYLADQIPPSELYILMQHVKQNDGTADDFISLLENYITVNNKNVRDRATRLITKFMS